jgi:hypothetical protein
MKVCIEIFLQAIEKLLELVEDLRLNLLKEYLNRGKMVYDLQNPWEIHSIVHQNVQYQNLSKDFKINK